jgi:hypothetical protein
MDNVLYDHFRLIMTHTRSVIYVTILGVALSFSEFSTYFSFDLVVVFSHYTLTFEH